MSVELKKSQNTTVAQMLPFVGLTDCDRFIVSKNNQLTSVIKLKTSVADQLDNDIYEQLWKTRKTAFDLLPSHYSFSIHSSRSVELIKNKIEIVNQTIQSLSDVWTDKFKESYQTIHYLVITTNEQSRLNKAAQKNSSNNLNKIDNCINVIDDLMRRIRQYSPVILAGDDLLGYFANIINNDQTPAVQNDLFDLDLSNTELYFPSNKNYFEYIKSHKTIYSCILSIKGYPSELMFNGFNQLNSLNFEYTIYQHYSSQSRVKSIVSLKTQINRLRNLAAFNSKRIAELEAIVERLEDESIKLYEQVFFIQVFAPSVNELNERSSMVQSALEGRGFLLLQENKNTELAFWSIFPGWEELRIRKYPITSDNLAHFVTLNSSNSGMASCTWGDKPIAQFLTDTNSVYNFTLHETTRTMALGNTIVVGGSDSGKTTLISFILSQCMQYKDFKAMIFDRRNGFKVFANIIGASYNDFTDKKQDINPLKLSEKDRAFLQSWLQGLLNKNDEQSIATISEALDALYEMPVGKRTLKNIETVFGNKKTGSIRQAVANWLPNGANGQFFNGLKDSLAFESPFTFFDTTKILDNTDVLGAMADYLFYRLTAHVLDNPCPHAIVIDELNKYIESPHFMPKIEETAAEIRKLHGVLILMIQSAQKLIDNPVYQKIKENIATYILFPNPKADPKYYIDGFGLNSAEFNWIKTTGGVRSALIKKKNSDGVIVNVDLSGLGKYLNVFDSSSEAVTKVNKLQKKHPNDWVDKYLKL